MTDLQAADPPAEAPVRLPSFPVRFAQTFVAPGSLTAALAREPRWAAALLVGALLTAGSMAAVPADLWIASAREQMLATGRPMPEGFDPGAFGAAQKWAVAVSMLVFWPLVTAVSAAIVAGIFAFVLGDDGRFRQHFAVVAHAWLIPAVGALLTLPLKLASGDVQLSLHLGLFLPVEEGWIAAFLRGLDLFALWGWAVVAIGATRIDPRRGLGGALAVVFGVAAAFAAVAALLSPG